LEAATRRGAVRTDPVHREGWVLTALLMVATVALVGTCGAIGFGLLG
jgi:hypothetical protein